MVDRFFWGSFAWNDTVIYLILIKYSFDIRLMNF
ncbi:hypothetical protein EV677_2467 [Herminiimonas fonticola]|uniref:Uncharacterized protein n=1 Tax=Herminiimonas fonticola TaxID=303380 RepID=A0A4R6G4S2_9BURK|nr:hypothetical protein Hfont_2504 [Herminiimonas fonticola]TDN88880.1 hypothetical protein EV677_2467 [Herminiimonas fonticola]